MLIIIIVYYKVLCLNVICYCYSVYQYTLHNVVYIMYQLMIWMKLLELNKLLLMISLSFCSRWLRIISSTFDGIAGTLVSPCWKSHPLELLMWLTLSSSHTQMKLLCPYCDPGVFQQLISRHAVSRVRLQKAGQKILCCWVRHRTTVEFENLHATFSAACK